MHNELMSAFLRSPKFSPHTGMYCQKYSGLHGITRRNAGSCCQNDVSRAGNAFYVLVTAARSSAVRTGQATNQGVLVAKRGLGRLSPWAPAIRHCCGGSRRAAGSVSSSRCAISHTASPTRQRCLDSATDTANSLLSFISNVASASFSIIPDVRGRASPSLVTVCFTYNNSFFSGLPPFYE